MKAIFSASFLCCFVMVSAQVTLADTVRVRDVYKFSWAYDLKVTVENDSITTTFYLEPDANYIGFGVKLLPGAIQVNDFDRNVAFRTFWKKAKMAEPEKLKERIASKHVYTRLPDKVILGYNCIGVKAESENEVAVFYFTNAAPAAHPGSYNKLPVHRYLLDLVKAGFNDQSLLMLSDIHLKKKKGHAKIECTALTQKPLEIKKADYFWEN